MSTFREFFLVFAFAKIFGYFFICYLLHVFCFFLARSAMLGNGSGQAVNFIQKKKRRIQYEFFGPKQSTVIVVLFNKMTEAPTKNLFNVTLNV